MPDATQIETYAKLLRLSPVALPTTGSPGIVASVGQLAIGQSPIGQRNDITKSAVSTRPLLRTASFILMVVLPVSVAVGYFWLLAADRYESEAQFILRVPGRAAVGVQMPNLPHGSGATRSNDDGFLVREYLESRDALALLERTAGLRQAYKAATTDPIWRFPNPFSPDTEETLYRHYRRMVSAVFDTTTGVSTLRVQAFSPSDAQRLTAALLDAAEGLVNRLNERARKDAIGLAEAEAERMRQRAFNAQAELTKFREREQLIDPGKETLVILETIGKLSMLVAQVSVQISELSSASPHSPQAIPLRTRRAALEAQIAAERQRLAGSTQSIAPRIAEYERLVLEQGFAEKALVAAMTAVEMARAEALRQQVYLERVATPGRPDYPAYPWRIIWCLGIFAASYMVWRIWRIVAAEAQRHVEP